MFVEDLKLQSLDINKIDNLWYYLDSQIMKQDYWENVSATIASRRLVTKLTKYCKNLVYSITNWMKAIIEAKRNAH